ncbi:MAG: amidohydrolase family protein [Chitinophagaceae bacterium]|nr:MAG: amidohydrolase family protein [Chitinophagaceae bacterium]
MKLLLLSLFFSLSSFAQSDSFYLLKPARVFDGEEMHTDWVVLVKGAKIEAAGPMRFKLPSNTRLIELPNCTLLPGLIEGHAHLFLHPYNETSWNDQVLRESRAERTARAVAHARATLQAGFTTVRDLGTEGAAYDDAGLKKAIEKGIVPGPRLIIATRAIVARGAYGPSYGNADLELPQGAAEVSGIDEMEREVRIQVSKGADLIKVYADYSAGPGGKAVATLSEEEIRAAVRVAGSLGRPVVAHATTDEGMQRATRAGVSTIEHGDNGSYETFVLMRVKGVALCPTLAAPHAMSQYAGWEKNTTPEPMKVQQKRRSFSEALRAGVSICMGGDVGVFAHGDNVRELELMTAYGMKPLAALRSATSVNAAVFGWEDRIGRIKPAMLADLLAVEGDPSIDISMLRKVRLVVKNGVIQQ